MTTHQSDNDKEILKNKTEIKMENRRPTSLSRQRSLRFFRNKNCLSKPVGFWGGFGLKFYLLLVDILFVGIVLICIPFHSYEGIRRVFNLIEPLDLLKVIGIILIYIVVSHFLSYFFHYLITKLLELHNESTTEDLFAPVLLGLFESLLFVIILLFNLSYVLIGTYITLKVIGQWVGWGGNNNKSNYSFLEAKKGRRRFNRFLIGNILRVLWAVIAFLIVKGLYFTS